MSSIVPSLYRSVIDDVISSVRDVFLDDGIDEQILAELKQTWERKLVESKGMEPTNDTASSSNNIVISNTNSNQVTISNSSSINQTSNSATNSAATVQRFIANNQGSNENTNNGRPRIVQVDGPNSSDEDDDDDDFNDNDDDDDNDDNDENDDENEHPGEEEEPLNSEDDVSDEDPIELFDSDNVVVCQYDKVTRSRNKWKFHLKMEL